MKKRKTKKNNAIKKIIIVLILLFIIAFIINISPNYIREYKKHEIGLISKQEEVTNNLKHDIYIKDEDIYLSEEDVMQFIDNNLYEEGSKIITTSTSHVAMLEKNKNTLQVNGANIELSEPVIIKNNITYLPISELENVYNIKVDYLEENNIVIIDFLEDEQIQALASKNINVKWLKNKFSKNVDKLQKGESTIIIKQENEWTKVLTNKGKIGYIKTNNLKQNYTVREKMTLNNTINNESEILNITLSNYTNNISTYEERLKIIEDILNKSLSEEKTGICINVDIQNEETDKFLIEIIPRLKEIGIKVSLQNQETINKKILDLL